MRRIFASVALMVPLFVIAALAQAPAPEPGPEHKKMQVYNGDWTCEGDSPASPSEPGRKVTIKQTFKMILGGFAQECEQKHRGPGDVTRSIWIVAYDSAHRVYASNGYGSDGGVVSHHGTVNGNVWDWSGTLAVGGKQYWLREKDTFATDLMSYIAEVEGSTDGKTWQPAGQIHCTKLKPEKKK